jgi:hypothetical protein
MMHGQQNIQCLHNLMLNTLEATEDVMGGKEEKLRGIGSLKWNG